MTNIPATRVDEARAFYAGLFGLNSFMDHGWIVTFTVSDSSATPKVSVAIKGRSGASVPDISVEIDNFDEVFVYMTAPGLPV